MGDKSAKQFLALLFNSWILFDPFEYISDIFEVHCARAPFSALTTMFLDKLKILNFQYKVWMVLQCLPSPGNEFYIPESGSFIPCDVLSCMMTEKEAQKFAILH